MKTELTDKIIGYHYTNSKAYRSMQTNGVDGYGVFGFNHFSGLIPSKRFIPLSGGNGLPDEACDGVIEGLLEPEPQSWLKNPEFPGFWGYLMHDICFGKDDVMLLSFELKPDDRAYVVERAHVERDLYRELKGQGKSTRETSNEASRKYWESRVLVFDYDDSYSAPQLSIWSGIPLDSLKVEWVKPTDEVRKRVLDNNW